MARSSESKPKVVVVGAGPGGLTAAMILASHGYDVEVFEKQDRVGGRNSAVTLGPYTFDLGPTFLMMNYILEEMFELTGRQVSDYLDLREVDPLYRLKFGEREFLPSRGDREGTVAQIERLFPGNGPGYRRLLEYEEKKFRRLVPCLRIPYQGFRDLLSPNLLRALPYLDAHRDLFSYLGRYFDDDDLKIAFTFQAKYLGMSPWQCPATFSLIAYLEHGGGVWHPIGGLNQISVQMAKVLEEEGGRVHLSSPIREVWVERGEAKGVIMPDGEKVPADYVVMNADFGHFINHLVDSRHLRRWTPERLAQKKFSCSTFMLYLGLDRTYDIPHHNIIFARDYKRNVDDIAVFDTLSEDPSFYIQNAAVTDPSLAPEGHSTAYILVPVANNRANIDWQTEGPGFANKVIQMAEAQAGMPELRKHIREKLVITPDQWQAQQAVHLGATFNLGHNINQMLIWRPHNKFDDFDRCYLVGGGTHPGSGVPTILESGQISARLILERDGSQGGGGRRLGCDG